MKRSALCLAVILATLAPAGPASAQRSPHIGYIYPAGIQRGTTATLTIGGQYLDGTQRLLCSNPAVHATIVEHIKPLTNKLFNDLRNKARELRTKQKAGKITLMEMAQQFKAFAKQQGLEDMTLMKFTQLVRQRNDPKRQPNPQISETVIVELTADRQADLGLCELRLLTKTGLTNPLFFRIDQFPQSNETEPNDKLPDAQFSASLPAVINGQITPGDVDRFAFQASGGMRLVVAVEARRLIPYLADAVPGWFQAVVHLYDEDGNELAFCDDFRFDPDPALMFEIPRDGRYILEIHDAIYRGREDFVYRITLGQIPFITDIYPLGGRAGLNHTVHLHGWNLPADHLTIKALDRNRPTLPVQLRLGPFWSNTKTFQLDNLPPFQQAEPNHPADHAQTLRLPVAVNGRIDQPGDRDFYRFTAQAGQRLIAEVFARRLGSPLDGLLTLTDDKGRLLAASDDHDDPATGLVTHQADPLIDFTLPRTGSYLLHVADAQNHGGPAYAYRLRLSPPRPDFQLRLVPASINLRTGQTIALTVHVLRHDGFDGPIDLALVNMPKDFILSGGRIPAGKDRITITLTAPSQGLDQPIPLHLVGQAIINGRPVRRTAVAAEDMMQAFLYRHLVPFSQALVHVAGPKRLNSIRLVDTDPVLLVPGGKASVHLAVPKWLADQMKVELAEAPKGLKLKQVTASAQGLAIELAAESNTLQPDQAGNLIFQAYLERQIKDKSGKKTTTRRIPMGVLPAVTYRVPPASRRS